jgi:arginine/lysine/ornithine decarboxylase
MKGTITDSKSGSTENLNTLRQEIQMDEQELKSQHLKQTNKCLQDELEFITNNLKEKQLHEQMVRIDIDHVQLKVSDDRIIAKN